jgi:hypothetical protein
MTRLGERELARCAGVREFRSGLVNFRQAFLICFLIGLLTGPSPARAASAISLAGIDFQQLCRETAHVPLVQAAIHPAYITVWTVQESRERGRYEQYSFRTQRIDVRVEHDISLYHGLIHRTLDLIGESQWRHRDLEPHEDHEHWLIYYTLEMHWPGLQRRQGNEPARNVLTMAVDYWRQRPERYNEVAAKAAELSELSWCAINADALEASVTPKSLAVPVAQSVRQAPVPEQRQDAAPVERPAPAAAPWPDEPQRALPVATAPASKPATVARLPEPQANVPAEQPQTAPPRALSAESLLTEPMWVVSEFGPARPVETAPKPRQPMQWAVSADLAPPTVTVSSDGR